MADPARAAAPGAPSTSALSKAALSMTASSTFAPAPGFGPAQPRTPWSRAVIARALRAADLFILLLIYAGLGGAVLAGGLLNAPFAQAAPWVLAPFLCIGAMRIFGAYDFRAHENAGAHAARVGAGALSGGGVAALLALAAAAQPEAVLSAGVLGASLLMLAHEGWRRWIGALSRAGRFAHNVVIVGATPGAERMIANNARTGEVNVMAVFDDRAASGRAPDRVAGAPVLGSVDDLFAWPDLSRADRIVIAVGSMAAERARALIERLRPLPHKIVLFLDLETFRPEETNLARIADLPVAYVSGRPEDAARLIVKRAEDIAASLLALAVFALPMALIALAVRLDSPGPVLFRQKRHGFNNRIIEVLKFRTMRADAASQPTRQVTKDDPRVTRLGRILRKTSLDELPQFFNVLRGEMSMVGPRPHAIDMKTGEVESARLVADYAHRARMKPGVTGWAQIHGSRGPVHTAAEVETRVRYDIDYIQRWSLWLDIWILLRTIPCLLGDSLRTR